MTRWCTASAKPRHVRCWRQLRNGWSRSRNKDGKQFNSLNAAISKPALKKISAEARSWRLHNRIGRELVDVARDINPIVRGWMNYYGAFNRSAMYPLLQRINAYLIRWIRNKYKRLRA